MYIDCINHDLNHNIITMSKIHQMKQHNILIAVTGSVATIKLQHIIEAIKTTYPDGILSFQIIATTAAQHFFKAGTFNETKASNPSIDLLEECYHDKYICGYPLFVDADEYRLWNGRSDPVLHIWLRKWADILVVAPLSANTLAKMANGLADNLIVFFG